MRKESINIFFIEDFFIKIIFVDYVLPNLKV